MIRSFSVEVFQWKGKKKTLTRRSNPCLQARRVEDQREAGIRSFPADRVVLTHRLPTGSITLSISSSGRCFHALSQTKPDVLLFRSSLDPTNFPRIHVSSPRRFSNPSDCSSTISIRVPEFRDTFLLY